MEQSTLNEYIEEYGADSDMVADHKERIADLYDQMGDSEEALKILEESAEVHIREMGREYMLPPLFRNIIHAGKKLFNMAEEPAAFAVRVRSVSGVYDKLGDIYLNLQNPEEAIKRYDKSRELFMWVSVPTGIEMVSQYFKVGVAHYCIDDTKTAIKHLNESLKHLHWTLTQSTFPEEVKQAEGFKEMLLNNIKEVLSCDSGLYNSEMADLYNIYEVR